jgi:hypothetical protein
MGWRVFSVRNGESQRSAVKLDGHERAARPLGDFLVRQDTKKFFLFIRPSSKSRIVARNVQREPVVPDGSYGAFHLAGEFFIPHCSQQFNFGALPESKRRNGPERTDFQCNSLPLNLESTTLQPSA